MKILVDGMPTTPTRCPYCEDKSTMDYDSNICTWNNSGFECNDTTECPFFACIENKVELVVKI